MLTMSFNPPRLPRTLRRLSAVAPLSAGTDADAAFVFAPAAVEEVLAFLRGGIGGGQDEMCDDE